MWIFGGFSLSMFQVCNVLLQYHTSEVQARSTPPSGMECGVQGWYRLRTLNQPLRNYSLSHFLLYQKTPRLDLVASVWNPETATRGLRILDQSGKNRSPSFQERMPTVSERWQKYAAACRRLSVRADLLCDFNPLSQWLLGVQAIKYMVLSAYVTAEKLRGGLSHSTLASSLAQVVGPEEGAVGSAAESWQHLICSVSVSVYLNPWDPFNRLMWFHVTQIFNNQNNGLQYTECRSKYENLVAFHQISTNNARETLRQWHWFPPNCAIYLLNELIKYWKKCFSS